MVETTKIAVDSGLKVGLPTKTEKPVFIERKVTCKTIAAEITSRISGKLIGFDDIFDSKTKTFLTEKELKAKGAVFIAISLNKILTKNDITVKGRTTKNPTPFIRKKTKYQIIANINWTSYINKRGHGDFVSAEQRANGVKNYENCRAVGEKIDKQEKTNYYVNGVIFRFIEKAKYYDENDIEYQNVKFLTSEYLKVASKESKQKEADKHGIELKFDPQYRTTRIDSCDAIRVFGFEYKPTENLLNK